MKNILIVSVLFALAAACAQAQGTINLNNTSTTKVATNMVVGGTVLGVTGSGSSGPQYRFAWFCSPTATSVNGQTNGITGGTNLNYAFNDTNWTLVAYGTNAIFSAGQFVSTIANGSGVTTVSNVAGGTSAQFVVIGWSANIGTSIASAQSWLNGGNPSFSGWIGQSAVSGSLTLGTSTATAATLFGASPPKIQGFTMGLVSPLASVAPFITSQPANLTVATGADAGFSVGNYGTPIPACQWMFNSSNIIVGATNYTLTINDVQWTNAGTYTALLTNTAGGTNSFAATLTVTPATGTGYIYFANSSAAVTKIYTNSTVGGPDTGLTTGSNLYYYALYVSPTATNVLGQSSAIVGSASGNYAFNDTNWVLAAYGTSGTNTGTNFFRGQILSLSADASGRTPVPGLDGGTTAQFVVIGWSVNVGTSIAAVQGWFHGGSPASNGWIGQSAVSGSIQLGNGGGITTHTLFGTAAPYLPGFTLGLASPVPGAVFVVPYAPPAILQTIASGGGLQLSWPTASGSFEVLSAPSPAGPWSDTTFTNGQTVPVTSQSTYYRLVAQ